MGKMSEQEIRNEAMKRVMWEVGHTKNDVTEYIADAVAKQVVQDEEKKSQAWTEVASDHTEYRLSYMHGIYSVTDKNGKTVCEFIRDRVGEEDASQPSLISS